MPDPRIAGRIRAALGSPGLTLDVGAGAGGYKHADLLGADTYDAGYRLVVADGQAAWTVLEGMS